MDLAPAELAAVLARAIELKAMLRRGEVYEPLRNKILAMIFDKSSTRTRVSFEAGMTQLGGNCMFLSPRDTQLGRGEPLEDTARVLSRMVDVIVIRTHEHAKIETFARHSRVPVINALTDMYHPCQLLADIQTFIEHRGAIRDCTAAWVGDGNNVCHSWMNAARQFGFTLRLATPKGYEPDAALLTACAAHVQPVASPAEAVRAADVVVTDTWASMGQEDEKAQRLKDFAGYRVDAPLMKLAHKDALFMHCLPAYRGMEVDAAVIDGPQSVVWDEAENRLHAQKALLEFLLVTR
ncbi:MAG: ornithine carbamoyltransferase [Gammaproteobacteria bacterium]|nr:ornithine carbamoyltransferase [Gammaproteobacteria bacterium]